MPQPRLKDRFGWTIEYLRLSVTDRCNLRCSYCMPKGFSGFGKPVHWLGFDEISRLTGAFAVPRVHRLRLTGGEPPLRRGSPTWRTGCADSMASKASLSTPRHAVRPHPRPQERRGDTPQLELKPERHEFQDSPGPIVRIMVQNGG